jgi:hypothetical protein
MQLIKRIVLAFLATGLLLACATAAGAQTVAVSVTLNEAGGTVTSTPAGINCSSTDRYDRSCTAYMPLNTPITLVAAPKGGDDSVPTPIPNFNFAGWTTEYGPSCERPAWSWGLSTSCTFTLDGSTPVSVVARFTPSTSYNSYPGCLQGTEFNPRWCTPNCADGVVKGHGTWYFSTGGAMFCAGSVESRVMSVGGLKTHSYTLHDDSGRLWPMRACYWRSSSAIWPTAGFSKWSSTLTASNSITKTRHWSYGVYFATPHSRQVLPATWYSSDGCDTKLGCVDTSATYGGCPEGYRLPRATAAGDAREADRARARRFARIASGVRSSTGVTSAHPRLAIVNRSTRAPGRFAISCPRGTSVLHADTAVMQVVPGEVVEPIVHHTARRATFDVRSLGEGDVVRLHLVCRRAGAATHIAADGSIKGAGGVEQVVTKEHGQHVMAGGGHDRVTAHHAASHVVAGHGEDHVVVKGHRSTVMGGPGGDTIIGNTAGTVLIEGGTGPDTLIAREGAVHINAQDGEGIDTVICEAGAQTRVRVDPGDTVIGPCVVVDDGMGDDGYGVVGEDG